MMLRFFVRPELVTLHPVGCIAVRARERLEFGIDGIDDVVGGQGKGAAALRRDQRR